ncbi:phage capsid protein [Micromonospora sp. NPDC004704]
MPMPTDGPWPPPAYTPAYQAYRDWNAWYVGDPALLQDAYQYRSSTQSLPPSQRVRAGQYAGGLVGTLSRWLWGAPPSTTQRDGRVHVPLPADLAATAANLLFAEPPALTHESPEVQARLDQLVEDGFDTALLHSAEANSILGDVYLRPVIDPDVFPDRAFPSAVHADGALPVLRHGKLIEVTFWSELARDGQEVIRLLEHHEPGAITYAVHIGTPDRLGDQVPLSRFAATADWADLDNGVQPTGLTTLDVVRIPNAGPQRRWRSTPGLRYLGRSDMDGNEVWFDRLDEVWTSWMRDLRLARGRILVPEYMLQSHGPGMGASFDAEREVFTTLTSLPPKNGEGGGAITTNQFEIRHVEHKATADAVVELALRHAGLSSQTLGEEGEVALTATEVQARERQSFTTRGVRIATWGPALAEYVELHMAVERVAFGRGPEPVRPSVEFGDSVSEAPETVARTLQLLHAAEAVSVDTKVRMVHPDWDDDQVKAEVDLIKGDMSAPVEVGPALGALAGNEPTTEGDGPPEE